MARAHRRSLLALAGAAAMLALYFARWATVTPTQIGRSDFTATYVGATLLGQGHRGDLYSEPLQAGLHARLIAPDLEGNLPFVNPPAAAVLALPVTTLPLATAYRVWSALQVGLLAAAVLVAARATPWPRSTPVVARAAIAALALAALPTASLLLLGQWDGLVALGLATGHLAWRRGHGTLAGLVLGAGLAIAKPHLAAGLAALILGWRQRGLLAGAIAGAAAIAGASLLAVGGEGCAGFVRAALASTTRWPLRGLLGFTGLFGAWLGDVPAAHALAAAGSVAALAACLVLGVGIRRRPARVEIALATGTALSLLAAPHLLGHDLTLLAPPAVWILATTPAGRETIAAALLWLALNCAAALDFGNDRPAPPGRLVPLVLLAMGVIGLRRMARAGMTPTYP